MYYLYKSISTQNTKSMLVLLLSTLSVGIFVSTYFTPSTPIPPHQTSTEKLYLIDKAGLFVSDISSFEAKIRTISQKLQIAPEWLMAVIHTESKFDRCASNNAGSEAVGLLQWMPRTIGEYGVSVSDLEESSHLEQLEYVYQYFNKMKRLVGSYNSLTDLYLAVLYPKALKRSKNKSYALYSYPSRAYELNEGLDLNLDGKVTIGDIEKKLLKSYPEAFKNVDDTQRCASTQPAFVSKDLQFNPSGS